MSFSQIKNEYIKGSNFDRYTQGSILENIIILEKVSILNDELELIEKKLPYAVILTQDCDLEWDYNSRQNTDRQDDDKILPSILLCPAYHAEKVREGNHLKEQNITMSTLNTSLYKPIKKNHNPRYHFLKADMNLQIPDLILDFKHYYTYPTDSLYGLNKDEIHLASISEVFRENLSQRFSQYISRIGLPVITQP